jgi:methylated-DNA-[protein]-cysteine S-methyltransferase
MAPMARIRGHAHLESTDLKELAMITASAQICHTTIDSPIGSLLLLADDEALVGAYMEKHKRGLEPQGPRRPHHAVLRRAGDQLSEYFAGARRGFDLPLSFQGTEFQRGVWLALCEIPFSETLSYAELAQRVARPAAVRAVGAAVGRNPISIIVPCHRVVGSNGSLTGFAGGLARKQWLLAHESTD